MHAVFSVKVGLHLESLFDRISESDRAVHWAYSNALISLTHLFVILEGTFRLPHLVMNVSKVLDSESDVRVSLTQDVQAHVKNLDIAYSRPGPKTVRKKQTRRREEHECGGQHKQREGRREKEINRGREGWR